MPYIANKLIINSIENISSNEYIGSPYKNEKDLLSYFLLLSRLGMNKFESKTIKSLLLNSEVVNNTLYELSGMFNPNEGVAKKGSLFFTTFYHKNILIKDISVMKDKSFYNAGTEFSKLKGRLPDTIDNSIADYLLSPKISNKDRYYSFLPNVEKIILKQYKKKYSLSDVLIWLYRTRKFETEITFDELYQLFLFEYNITDDQVSTLFTFNTKNLYFQNNYIDAALIRNILDINSFVKITPLQTSQSVIQIHSTSASDVKKIGGVKMNKTELKSLIEKYKQVIITGVPGTGKTFMIEEIAEDYKVKKVQFHQNYTYQEFMLGKTIQEGNVIYERGVFLEFLISVVNINPQDKYLFIIDEINRGNTSAIFGELLYALDRDNPIELANGDKLELPDNLYFIGSMNSADRSIALVDYAVRRRFLFAELEPDYNLLDTISEYNNKKLLGNLLQKINIQIELILKNRDFRLGHSYFIVKDKKSLEDLDIYEIINYKIIPILYEYVQGDTSLINQILTPEIVNTNPSNIYTAISNYIQDDGN